MINSYRLMVNFMCNNPNQVIQITIKGYMLIPMALNEFGECFNLEVNKEIMPYEIYTEDNLLKEYAPITEAIEAIKKSIEHKYYNPENQENEIELAIALLVNNIDSWDLRKMMSLIL